MKKNIAHEFMDKTRHFFLGPSDQQQGVSPPSLVLTRTPQDGGIALPPPETARPPIGDFLDLVTKRTSLRRYAPEPLSTEELSFLLWCTQGVKTTTENRTMRTVPSAGARHAFETVVLINRVSGITPGLYGYAPIEHCLAPISCGPSIADEVTAACFNQRFIHESAVTFIWIAVPYRMTWRYVERGYRYLHLDAGHVCQNLYLAGEALGCGTCAVAAFNDDELNRVLGLDGEDRFVIYLAATGKRQFT
jgi:SagB-type dehydrogenase family enzyme